MSLRKQSKRKGKGIKRDQTPRTIRIASHQLSGTWKVAVKKKGERCRRKEVSKADSTANSYAVPERWVREAMTFVHTRTFYLHLVSF